jgi:hypothetical protein
MVKPPGGGQPQTEDLISRLEVIVTAARLHLTNGEILSLEELLSEYVDNFAEADEDYVRTNKILYITV